ncbi:MAG: PTS sugar transporter subunit IIA [Planctomycetaceae bacterium]
MSHEWMTLEELARQLGRDRREIERLVQRGRLPGHKVSGDWQFHTAEITHWLEQEMREYTDRELAAVEASQLSSEPSDEPSSSPISEILHPETVQVPLEARTKRSVMESLIEIAGRTWQVWQPATVLKAVREREEVMSTAFENGVAIPHPRNPVSGALGESILAYGRTLSGIPYGGPGRSLTDIFFLVLCKDSKTHLLTLARLGRLIQLPEFLDDLRNAPDSASSYRVIIDADAALS